VRSGRINATSLIYYLAHAVVIAVGAALTLLHNSICTAIGTSLIAAGAAGVVIYLYIGRTETARQAIETLSRFGLARVYKRRAAQRHLLRRSLIPSLIHVRVSRSITVCRQVLSRAGDQHGQPWTVVFDPEKRKVGSSILP
jgi:hypothetical protein